MPANTSPDNIVYPVSTDPVAPLETVFANMANSVQDAFDGFRTDWTNFEGSRAIQTFRWANAAARTAQTGMVAGDVGYQIDTNVLYRRGASAWIAWQSQWTNYAVTTTGLTVGSSVVRSAYRYDGGDVKIEIDFSMGAGSAMGTGPTFSLPVNMAADYLTDAPVGAGVVLVAGNNYPVEVWRASVSTIAPYVLNAGLAYAGIVVPSAAIPATWGTTGKLQLRASYRPA